MVEEFLKKLKKLKVDTIFSYKVLGFIDDKRRVYLSRLADRGEIVKVGRGKFYKPSNKTVIKPSQKTIALDKSLFKNDLFWSIGDGVKVDIDTLIESYLKTYTEDDLISLYTLFGYKRLLMQSLKLYKDRKHSAYQEIKQTLLRCEQWRLDDKIDLQLT
jgi:hypothetical protein